ncbi:hypothetical protein [Nonomuraea insulae]|uniref:Uncharacterized protein n=1 Tax=Nonomuraea insulae TaxID=1616787 RepID=A0ABW1CV43_9ACTN
MRRLLAVSTIAAAVLLGLTSSAAAQPPTDSATNCSAPEAGPLANLWGATFASAPATGAAMTGFCQHLVNFGLADHSQHGIFDDPQSQR